VSIARDITVRREADAALARAVAQLEHQNRELRRSNEDLDNFAAVASHDLAQPLQVAFGYLEMLQSDFAATLDPKAAAWLDQSVRSLDRMRRLVQDILQYARTGSSKDAAPGPVDLAEVAHEAIAALADQIDARGAMVDLTIAPECATVEGHEGMLTLLFQNLVGNAVKFVAPTQTPHVTVTVTATGEGGTLLTVADNGPGVPPGQRDRVFDMFQRNHGADVGGSGLGLAICKKIVHRHRGRIWVEDGPDGQGAAFNVLLP
jgi:signal transduction histidine kinase